MTINIWNKPSGYSLGTYNEREDVNISLPVENNLENVEYLIISGTIPPGLTIKNNSIIGNPFIVATTTTFTFCIRAILNNQISDRTYKITILGSNPPEFVTERNILDIGLMQQLFAINGTYIEYIIEATELLPTLRKDLKFYISDGKLPPGLSLNETGVISGITHTDYNLSEKIYNVNIAVTDGYLTTFKSFVIYVVGPLYLTADSPMLDTRSLYTADIGKVKPIQWITPGNLGSYRSNNFIIIEFEIINGTSDIIISIDNENNLPKGMNYKLIYNSELSMNIPVIYGNVSSQSFNATTYTFNLIATRYSNIHDLTSENIISSKEFSLEIIGDIDNTITWNNITGKNAKLTAKLGNTNNIGLPNSDQLKSIIVDNGGSGYKTNPSVVIVPTDGGDFALAYCTIVNEKIYTANVTYPGSGYNTEPNILLSQSLGKIDTSSQSTFFVSAKSNATDTVISYKIIHGLLPPGLSLTDTGEIIGKVNKTKLTKFKDIVNQNINNTTYDNNTTTFDKNFVFTIRASNQYGSSNQAFSILVDNSNDKDYSNIYVKPLLKKSQRLLWNEFINNQSIFPLDKIYRLYDKSFGFNMDLSMLIYAGIETTSIESYINATKSNNNIKRFLFGDVKMAVAKDPVTNNNIYEIIYIEMNDPRELNKKHLPLSFDYNNQIYNSNSVTNWQINLSNAVTKDGVQITNNQNLLPVWMKTMTNTQIPGFVLALPICYCKVGEATSIMLNINNYISNKLNNFSFNKIDYTIDRYIIDAVYDKDGSQYIVFNNNRTTI